MAESVVSFVVKNIGDLLIQEGNFLAGVSRQVRQLQDELRHMQRLLEDADKRQDESQSVRGWVSDIRELAYDAENVIETFALQVAERRQNGFRNKCKRYATIFIEGAHLYIVGKEIEAIQDRISRLTRSLSTYGIQIKNEPQGSTSVPQKLRRSYSHLVEEHTIGLDSTVKNLVTKLLSKETGAGEIVSISGMGGLGKTTLANKVYHHDKVRSHFDAFAWYCVSQQFQARQVWEGIFSKLVVPSKERRDEISKMNDDEIAKELYLLRQKKKCLVVLDDIWTEDAWDLLKPALPLEHAVGGSKILLTTRNKTLALHADPRAFSYELQTLNEHNSWELFQRKAFLERENHDFKIKMGMEELGMELVKQCAGLPLAIIVLGGLLATKDFPREWENVRNNVNLYLRGKRIDQEYSVVDGVLALSYNELPYCLKPCFLHLGHFPEDYDISCMTLFRMWAAEGFVSHCQHGETMEDVAKRYLRELVNRSIVQETLVGEVDTCRLHDLMRNFCLSKANEENYLESVGASNLNEKTSSNSVYRLVVHQVDLDLACYPITPSLRSLFLFSRHKDWDYTIMKARFNDFKLLKILSLERCTIGKKMGKEIGGLIHLRYLAFINCDIGALPSSIGNLRYLQTLIIDRDSHLRLTLLSNVLWKLEQLRHVILRGWWHVEGHEWLKLGNMINLQTLHLGRGILLFDVGELVSSSHLKEVEITIHQNLEEIPITCLGRLTFLTISVIRTTTSEEALKRFLSSCPQLLKLSYMGKIEDKLPECQHFPPYLTKLTLEYCFLEEDPMPILEKLSNLRILGLYLKSFQGRLLICSSKGFPKLQTLQLISLHSLEEWRVDEEAMPNLSQLEISYCWKLKTIPEGIKFISTLRTLEISFMAKEFEDRIRGDVDGREGEDFYKVRYVPSIIIRDTCLPHFSAI